MPVLVGGQAACKNAAKRLPSNAEWQAAVIGTPDHGPDNGVTDCKTATAGVATLTGARTSCVSADGAFDMVGNLNEWVADWVPKSVGPTCGAWSAGVSGDAQCWVGADASVVEPAGLIRGGAFPGVGQGPLAVDATGKLSVVDMYVGFRCAR